MRPIVFLDIDGVLNTSKNYEEWEEAMRESGKAVTFASSPDDSLVHLLFDPALVNRLNTLTEDTGAEIVVSSSWRNLYSDFDDLVSVLRSVGVLAPIIDRTLSRGFGRGERGDQVAEWIRENEFEGPFVCLDDGDDFEAVWDNFVHVNPSKGLTLDDVYRAYKILGGVDYL